MSPSEVYRVLVLSGAKHDYMPLGLARHARFEVVGVADDDSVPDWLHARNQDLAERLGVPYLRDVEKAISELRPQVACVTPQVARHAELSVRAAEVGLHVVQDKPMARRVEDCDRVVQAVEQADVRFLMWNRNSYPAIEQARRLLVAGKIGRPFAIHADFYFSKDAGVLLDTEDEEDVPENWMADGELTVEGIYPLAYIRHLVRAEVRRVFARTTAHFFKRHAARDVEDLASVTLEMDDGILGTLSIGRIGRPSHPNLGEIKLHILGSDGALVISEARPEISIYRRGQPPEEFRQRRVGQDYESRLFGHFAAAIDNGGPTMLTARDGRAICATVTAAVESGRSGRPVDVA